MSFKSICNKCGTNLIISPNGISGICPKCNHSFHEIKVLIPKSRIKITIPNFPGNFEETKKDLSKIAKAIVSGIVETMNTSFKKKWDKIEDISRDRMKIVWETMVIDVLTKNF